MLYSEQAVRENLRNRDGRRVFYLAKGDQLTSAARDYLQRERIEILPAEKARPERYALPGGGFTEEKPEHMTHLHGTLLVPKDHPQIVFRGKLDSLEAELISCQLAAPALRDALGEVLALAGRIMASSVLGEALGEITLRGLTEAEQRQRSHFPARYYGIPHFMPAWEDGPVIAALNRARCAAREAELAAVTAFRDREGVPTRPDILQAMNRMSSMLYLLMLEEKAGAPDGEHTL